MDHFRERQGWTTVCSFIPERDGNDQEENSPNQAGSRAGSFAVVDLALRLFCFVLFCFGVYLPLKSQPFVQPFFDMHAPQETHADT